MSVIERHGRWLAGCVRLILMFIGLSCLPMPSAAHNGLASPFDYNRHVYPILRDRCGSCHFDGGPAPMALLDYADAQSWAEAMREQLVAGTMPPGHLTPTLAGVTVGHQLTPRELDVLLTWVNGGTPRGVGSEPRAAAHAPPAGMRGQPDLILQMPSAHTVSSIVAGEERTFALRTGLGTAKWLRAVEFQPGTRSLVRSATIQVKGGPVLGVWVPGADALSGGGFRLELPEDSTILLRIRYHKSHRDIGRAVKDRSSVGLYFTTPPTSDDGTEIEVVTPRDTDHPQSDPRAGRVFAGAARRLLAVRPIVERPYASLRIEAIFPTGKRVALLTLRSPVPEWERRYWFDTPIELPAHTRISALAVPLSSPADEGPVAEPAVAVELVSDPL